MRDPGGSRTLTCRAFGARATGAEGPRGDHRQADQGGPSSPARTGQAHITSAMGLHQQSVLMALMAPGRPRTVEIPCGRRSWCEQLRCAPNLRPARSAADGCTPGSQYTGYIESMSCDGKGERCDVPQIFDGSIYRGSRVPALALQRAREARWPGHRHNMSRVSLQQECHARRACRYEDTWPAYPGPEGPLRLQGSPGVEQSEGALGAA